MKTIDAILTEVNQYKPLTRRQLYRYFGRFGIKPAGVRQRPQLYPDDTTKTVLLRLGLDAGGPWIVRKGRFVLTNRPMVSMSELRRERERSRGKAAK